MEMDMTEGSLDDAMSESCPEVCDECMKHLESTEPHPVVGWQMLVFKCKRCEKEFCSHLEAKEGSLVCVDCSTAGA